MTLFARIFIAGLLLCLTGSALAQVTESGTTITGSSTQTEYDALGRKTAQIDAMGARTDYQYDANGHLTQVKDPLGNITTYAYDSTGHKISQTDAHTGTTGHTTTWTYNEVGRITSHTLPMGQSETFSYDANGNQISHTDFNGQVTTNTYDSLNRLVSQTTADGTTTYSYNAEGNQTAVTQTQGGNTRTTTNTYNSMGSLTSTNQPNGTTLAYSYDANGNKTKLITTLPNGTTQTTSYAYDADNRLVSVTTPTGTTTYSYDANGNQTSKTLPNGVTTTYTYNSRNRLTEQQSQNASGQVLTSYTYTLDAAGRRLQITEANGRQSNYSYDAAGRLLTEDITDPTNGNYSASYQYDAAGNRIYSTINGVQTQYTYNANDQLTQAGGNSYSYDANGNTLSQTQDGQTISYAYDANNRLASVTTPTGTTSYTYDAEGIRISKTSNGQTTNYVIDPNQPYAQVVAEIQSPVGASPAGEPTKLYTYGNDLISQSQSATGQTSYYLTDGLGSTRALTNSSGTTTDSYNYSAFGNLLSKTGSTQNNYRFTGEQYDSETSNYYLRARYMNPTTGRFTQRDTFAGRSMEPITLHKYLYANDDPLDGVDLSGLVFTPSDGRTVEKYVCEQYRLTYYGAGAPTGKKFPFSCGRAVPIAVRRYLKPDILDFQRLKYAEVKPLSPSGIAKGIPQIERYDDAYGNKSAYSQFGTPLSRESGFTPPPTELPISAGNGNIIYFINIDGLIFYTDNQKLRDVAGAAGLLALRGVVTQALRSGVVSNVTIDATLTNIQGYLLRAAAASVAEQEADTSFSMLGAAAFPF